MCCRCHNGVPNCETAWSSAGLCMWVLSTVRVLCRHRCRRAPWSGESVGDRKASHTTLVLCLSLAFFLLVFSFSLSHHSSRLFATMHICISWGSKPGHIVGNDVCHP